METDDELPPRRTSTPLGRLDDQRAGFTAHASTSASVYEPYSSPRTRRPSPKSAGSALLPSKPQSLSQRESWERVRRATLAPDAFGSGLDAGGARRRASLRRIDVGAARAEEEGPFADASRWDGGGYSARSETSSLPPLTPEMDFRRRGSAVSTSSAFSSSPQSHTYPPLPNSHLSFKRHSVSSFGAYTINTIGDKSTTSSSMPLLRRQGTRESHESRPSSPTRRKSVGPGRRPGSSGGGAAAGPSLAHLDSSAASLYSFSETSSLHSYPPRPRQRATSTVSSSESGEGLRGGRKSWAREIEATGATGQVQRRGSADSRVDQWPSFVTNSVIHQPLARPVAAYQSTLAHFSFPAPSRTPTQTSPTTPPNPLAPLRKRLARSLASTLAGRRLHTEVQLLLELVDALEHCITSFAPSSDSGSADRSSSDASASSTSPSGLAGGLTALAAVSSPSLQSVDENPLSASTTSTRSSGSTNAAGLATSQSAKLALVDEVRLLTHELIELVPDARHCLVAGRYGPLGGSGVPVSVSVRALLASLEGPGAATAADPDWWPRRLARDCRALLEEAGLPTGQGTAAQTVWMLAAQLSEREEGSEDAGEDTPSPSLTTEAPGPAGAGLGAEALDARGAQGRPSAARKEELLQQGKQRWEKYRERQSALEQYADSPPL
ncbi:uncharacterized protein JCM10292_000189 [Rhodotorula paludigena]|uniref:uncharacterized protein n=1 Tax=Rhodotorula paludigena TaxID=86838 RepID=UPI0031800559